MIRAGFTIDNPVIQSLIIVLKGDVETNGLGWLVEVHRPPHARPDIAEHLHLTWKETFEIISGTAHYKLNGVEGIAKASEHIVVLPRQPHIHPWNAGDSEMVYRHSTEFERPNPQAVQEGVGVLATLAGLAREGKVNQRGQPKNPWQLAVTLKAAVKYGTYDASLPIPLQNFLAATLASLAEALGYKASYPQYLNEQ